MYYAKSIYLGGKIICAEDTDYSSYLEYGLVCLECRQEVYLKHGEKKQPHFAHFQIFDDNECSLRVTGYSQGWSNLTAEGKGQRRKLFYEHFLHMIAINSPNFYTAIKITRDKIEAKKLTYFTQNCTQFFCESKHLLIMECRILHEKDYDNKFLLQKIVACEAIDYLCTSSNKTLLEKLIHYSIYKYLDSILYDWNGILNATQPSDICHKLKHIILENDWVSAFSKNLKKYYFSVNASLNSDSLKKDNELLKAIQTFLVTDGDSLQSFSFGNFNKAKLDINSLYINLINFEQISSYKFKKVLTTIGRITNFHVNHISQTFIIDWEFVDLNCIGSDADYTLGYKNWQVQIENFLTKRIKNNLPVKFNLIENNLIHKIREIDSCEKELEEKIASFTHNQSITCPDCKCIVKKTNLIKHFRKVHRTEKINFLVSQALRMT